MSACAIPPWLPTVSGYRPLRRSPKYFRSFWTFGIATAAMYGWFGWAAAYPWWYSSPTKNRSSGWSSVTICPLKTAGPVELIDVRLGDALLLGVGVEDRRAVLPPDVRALAVQGGWVVRHREEQLEDLAEADPLRVEADLDGLGVVGPAAADRVVVGRLGGPASVPRGQPEDALDLGVDRLDAPEAAAGQHHRLLARGVGAATSTSGSGNSSGEICSEVSPQPAIMRLLPSIAPATMPRSARDHHLELIEYPWVHPWPQPVAAGASGCKPCAPTSPPTRRGARLHRSIVGPSLDYPSI